MNELDEHQLKVMRTLLTGIRDRDPLTVITLNPFMPNRRYWFNMALEYGYLLKENGLLYVTDKGKQLLDAQQPPPAAGER